MSKYRIATSIVISNYSVFIKKNLGDLLNWLDISEFCFYKKETERHNYKNDKLLILQNQNEFISFENEKNRSKLIIQPYQREFHYLGIFIDQRNDWLKIILELMSYANELGIVSTSVDSIIKIIYGYKTNATFNKIDNAGKLNTYDMLGRQLTIMNVFTYGVDVMPDTKVPKEMLLKAPAHKVYELDNGCVYLQIADSLELDAFDQNYYDSYLRVFDYLNKYKEV